MVSQMKVEIQCDSSTANFLTHLLGAGPKTKHIDTLKLWVQERVQDGDVSIKKSAYREKCRDVGPTPVSASVPQQHLLVGKDGIYRAWIPHSANEPAPRCVSETKTRQSSEMVVLVETGAKVSVPLAKVNEFGTVHDEWTMTGEEEPREEEKEKQATCNKLTL